MRPNIREVIERLVREAACIRIYTDTILNDSSEEKFIRRMLNYGHLQGLYTALYLLHGWTDHMEEIGDPESRGCELVVAWRKQHGMFSDDPVPPTGPNT